jgi:surface polysaccharide O-acyltransferase-like enzyme
MPSVETLKEPAAEAVAAPPVYLAAPDAPRATAKAPTERLANVERVRLVAMFEIVAFHVSEQRLPVIAGLGLPAFLLLNNAFNCTLSERMGTRAFLRVKVAKLLLPWLVWSLVYAAVLVLEKLRHHEAVAEAFSGWMLIGGTYTHLWFVPFALAGGLFVAWLQARTRRVSQRRMTFGMLAVGSGVVLTAGIILSTGAVEWPALQWLFALPSPVLGFALGRAVLAADRRLLIQASALVCLVAVGCWVLSLAMFVPEMVTRYATALAVVMLAFLWPGRMDPFSKRLTPLLFGIYLCHPLLLRIYQGAHLPQLPVAVFAAIIFFGAAALVAVLRRTPLRRLV